MLIKFHTLPLIKSIILKIFILNDKNTSLNCSKSTYCSPFRIIPVILKFSRIILESLSFPLLIVSSIFKQRVMMICSKYHISIRLERNLKNFKDQFKEGIDDTFIRKSIVSFGLAFLLIRIMQSIRYFFHPTLQYSSL